MSSDAITFDAQTREPGKKSDLTELRASGFIPAVMYADGNAAVNISLNEHEFGLLLKRHSGESLMIQLSVDGAAAKNVLIKDIQHHPLTSRMLHVDFHEISLDRRVKVMLPVSLVNTPVGVSSGGGTLDIQTREIEVECKASDIVEALEVDVTGLDIGENLLVSSVTLPEGFVLQTPGNVSIATVLKPRVSKTATAEAGAE